MIGVDTNVLLRLLLQDNIDQHRASVALFSRRNAVSPAFVSIIVLVELMWSLARTYGYSKSHVRRLVAGLAQTPDIRLQHSEAVDEALSLAERSGVDMADSLIAIVNRVNGCIHTVTFDKKAAKQVPSMELLA